MSKLINMFPFRSPDDSESIIGDTKGTSVLDMIDFLSDDDAGDADEIIDLDKGKEKKVQKEEKTEETDDETSDDEDTEKSLEDELEEEIEEPDAEELDEDIVMPHTRKEILAKYPSLYKDFPHLERAFYREKQYTEIYPTLQDAKESQAKAGTWDQLESDLGSGNVENIFTAIAKSDKNTFYKIVDSIIPTIAKIDKDAATHINTGIAKQIIEMMYNAGGRNGSEHLKAAAESAYQFLFGDAKWEPHTSLAQEVKEDPRVKQLAEREKQIASTLFENASSDVGTKVNNSIRSTIVQNIDPKESMSDYVKGKATDDVFKEVQHAIREDKRFQSVLNKLWHNAARNNYNEPTKQAIRSALLSKAKQLLPAAIAKGRKTALGSVAKQKSNGSETVKPDPKVVDKKKTGTSVSPMSGKTDRDRARAIPKNVSTKDFLLND